MSTPTVREQFLVISALGANPMELTNVLCRASHENRCAVVTSRLTRHGECSALVLEVSGSWDALARLEGSLPTLAKRHAFTVNVVRSAALKIVHRPCRTWLMSALRIARTSSTSCASSSWITTSSWKT